MAVFRRTKDGEPYIESDGKIFSKSFSKEVQPRLADFKDGDKVGIEFNYNMHMTIISIWKPKKQQ